jgi:hypothetical protein
MTHTKTKGIIVPLSFLHFWCFVFQQSYKNMSATANAAVWIEFNELYTYDYPS